MKSKFIVFILTVLLFSNLVSCSNENLDVNNENQTNTEEVIPTYPCFKTDKLVYKKGDKINVKLYNTENCKRVVLTEYGREPSTQYSIYHRKLEGVDEVSFTTYKLEKVGDFTLWLCGEDNYDYIYTVDIHIDDEDENDYQITNAKVNCIENNNLVNYSISVNTNYTNELTYRLYWCNNGVRLAEYMAIKTVVSKDLKNFNIELPSNIVAPNEANQIEISVVEGVSTSYYLNADVFKKMPIENMLFNFNAISDLHVQSLKDSILFNSHLKTALKDIYNSESKAIMAVGDIINFGKAEEYVFFNSIYESIENKNNIPLYPAIGNHEYMYFSDFSEPLGYFKSHFKLESHYYSFELEGNKFIVLGSDTKSLYGQMSNEQFNWLAHELAEIEKNENVFIFIHQPFIDTVDGTLFTSFGQTSYGNNERNDQLRQLFKDYPNAFIFSGHSHQTLEGLKPVAYGNGTDASFINCGSMGYLCEYVAGVDMEDIGGSEGLYVEVYEDCVIIRGRDFSYGRWVSNCQILLPLNK